MGADSNVFNLISICQRALKKQGYYNEAQELEQRVYSCENFNRALQIMMEYVEPVEIGYDENDISEFEKEI